MNKPTSRPFYVLRVGKCLKVLIMLCFKNLWRGRKGTNLHSLENDDLHSGIKKIFLLHFTNKPIAIAQYCYYELHVYKISKIERILFSKINIYSFKKYSKNGVKKTNIKQGVFQKSIRVGIKLKHRKMAWATYHVRYTIVYADGQRTTTGSTLNLESATESLAIDTLKRQNSVPQNATIIINGFEKVG